MNETLLTILVISGIIFFLVGAIVLLKKFIGCPIVKIAYVETSEDKPVNNDTTSAPTFDGNDKDAIAGRIGYLMARYYIDFKKSILQSLPQRSDIFDNGVKLWNTNAPEDRFQFLNDNHTLVTKYFIKAITENFRHESANAFGFTEKDFDHIARSTPGNPDITPGFGGVDTGDGTALVGPKVEIKEKNISLTMGAGVEVDYSGAGSSFLNGEDVRTIADKNVKGGGVWIGIQISC